MWNIKSDCRGLSDTDIINTVLLNRDIIDIEELSETDGLLPYSAMKNIDEATNIVWDGIKSNKRFLVYADVDCDGCTSCAIMYHYLNSYNADVEYSINKGKKHGIKDCELSVEPYDIIIIVDSINEADVYKPMLDMGKQIIVLDHHQIPDGVLNCGICLVSSANNYPNPQLSGAGVVWKFCKYIDEITLNNYADDLVDLAACGIIADMCGVGVDNAENRTICNLGFNNQKNIGIKKINGSYEFNAQAVSFGIATLVNAACRTFQNEQALSLFISDDTKQINKTIKELKQSKELQNNEVTDLIDDIENQYRGQEDSKVLTFVIDSDLDIAGLIGNKLLEKYQRPLFVLRHRENDKTYAGSARGIGIDDFKKYVDETELATTGGHENAFGVEFREEDRDKLISMLNEMLADVEFINKRDIDIQLSTDQINSHIINVLKNINRVSGTGFKPVTVMVDNITDYNVGTMSNGKHLKINCGEFTAIKWNYTGYISEFDNEIVPKKLSLVGQLDANFFGRTYTRQLIIDDYRIEDLE